MSAIEDRAGNRVVRYAICLTALLVFGASFPSARHVLWPLAALSALVAMGLGPAMGSRPTKWRAARRRAWWAAAGLLAVDAAVVAALAWSGRAHPPTFGSYSDVYDVVAYLSTAVAVLLVISGRVRRATWLGEVDFLVLFTTLTALIWTLLLLLLARGSSDGSSWAGTLVAYVFFDALVLVILGRELRRGRPPLPLRLWLLAAGAQAMMSALIGALVVHETGDRLPEGWLPAMRLLWLAGLAVLGGYAITPAAEAETSEGPTVDTDQASGRTSALHRPTAATATLLAVALLGPPLEIAHSGLANVVTLCLVAMVFLLLREARRRARAQEAIRSTAVVLAGAPDTSLILSSTLAAADFCTTGRHAGIVVCANGPEGPSASATVPADEQAAERVEGEPRPAARVDLALSGQPHLTVLAPGQSADAAQFALGVVGEETELAASRGQLELLAAQAGHALDRVRLTAERSRRASEAHFRTLVRNAADVIMIVDGVGAIRFASPSARSLLGEADLSHATVLDVFGPANAEVVRHRLARAYDSAQDPAPEYWTLRRDGRRALELEVRFADLRTDPTVGGLVLTIRDVTEQHELQRELKHLAFHDVLTGLGNGIRFAAQIEAAIADAARPVGGRADGAVVLIAEIDDVWDVHNLRGPRTVDRVLIALARRLGGLTDAAARMGGAIFAALAVPAEHGCRDAGALARYLQQELSEPLDLGTESVSVHVSVGAVPAAGLGDADDALSRAGLALAGAKRDGRRAWRVYQPTMLDAALDRAALNGELAAAVAGESLAVHYQPIVDLRTGTVGGFEALARWQHPDRGAIPPGRFIPLAEETGLIVPLGRWALRRAAADLARMRESTHPARQVRVTVNVSPLQLTEPDFPAEVAAILDEAGVPAGALCLEITENSMLDQSGRTLEVLRELKAMGLSLAIDDFGTGHSALSYLPDLPFDMLKVDRSFITTIATSPSRAEVVRGIVRIAGAVGMRVVAEGIETDKQQDLLVDASCHYGQGYFYSRPVPMDQALLLLDRTWPTAAAVNGHTQRDRATSAHNGTPPPPRRDSRPIVGLA